MFFVQKQKNHLKYRIGFLILFIEMHYVQLYETK